MGTHNCHLEATCVNTIGSYNCICNAGYSGDGLNCGGKKIFFFLKNDIYIFFKKIDDNECLTNNGGCHDDANCENTIGSFTCDCKSGYLGDGFNCTGELFFFFFFWKFNETKLKHKTIY